MFLLGITPCLRKGKGERGRLMIYEKGGSREQPDEADGIGRGDEPRRREKMTKKTTTFVPNVSASYHFSIF
jgi:hypothetical protein